MGYDTVKLTVTAAVSRHNSEQDREDDYAWERFCNRVHELAAEPEFSELWLDVF